MPGVSSLRIVPGELTAGRYRVGRELGRGGMSAVYQAHDTLEGREIALKVLRVRDDDASGYLYLQQEFRAMSRLYHPRLVQVFDYGVLESGVPFFTMELLGGQDLSHIGALELDQVFQVLLSVADVLGFMHARGYVHRDVKPANVRVLCTPPGQPWPIKLMDCGLTEQLGQRGETVAGTPPYLAPEAWFGAPADVRGDLYALGVLAYEITTGALPFEETTGVRLLQAKSTRSTDLRDVRPDVPLAFARLVRDLLAPEPASRPASALEVVARLSAFAEADFNPDPNVYLRTPALVGRNRELAELRQALGAAAEGKPVPIVISGPAGAGKTRLLDEALLEAGLRGSLLSRATGRGFGGGSYEVLQNLTGPLLCAPGAERVLERIGGRAALGPARPSYGPGGWQREPEPIAARRGMHQALGDFLGGLSQERPIVLGIDDIHLVDAASLDALGAVMGTHGTGKVALVGTRRDGEAVSPSLENLLSSCRRLELARMTEEQTRELLVRTLGPVTPSAELVRELVRQSSGNVYFLLEILRHLATRGLIERKRSKISLPDTLEAVELPRSLVEALKRRVARLSPPAVVVARVVAVVGRNLELELSRVLAQLGDEDFLDAVDELRREELVNVQELRLQIHHPRVREVLYHGMPAEERRLLHRRVAEELEQRLGSERYERAAELGHHFAAGGQPRRALTYLVMAGDARYQAFAYFDVGEAYRRALDLLPASSWLGRSRLERKLNDRLGRIAFYHDHHTAPRYLERARRIHLRHGLLWTIGPVSRWLGAACAVSLAVAATTLYNLLGWRRHPVRLALEHLLNSFAATTYLCNCYTYTGRLRLALEAAEQLTPFIYSKRRLPRMGYLLARAPALLFMHRFDESAASCEEALTILRDDQRTPVAEHDRVHATGGALITRLWNDSIRGYVRGSRWWSPLEEYGRIHPTAMLEAWLMEAQVFAAYRRGNLAETRAAWARFADKASEAEVLFVQGKGRVWLGMALLDAGHASEAQDVADEVIRDGRERDNPMLLALGLLLRGVALHAWEQLDEAQRLLGEARALARRPDVGCYEVDQAACLAEAVLALDVGDLPHAARLAQEVEAANSGRALPHDLHRARARRVLGRVALREGRTADAVRHLRESLALAEQVDDVLERAHGCHYLAEALALQADSEGSIQRRAECRRLLMQLGNAHQLRRLGYADRPQSESSEFAQSSGTWQFGLESSRPAPDSGDREGAHLGDTQRARRNETPSRTGTVDESGSGPVGPRRV